jgi:hypothetical protein
MRRSNCAEGGAMPMLRAAASMLVFMGIMSTPAQAQWYQGPSGAAGGAAFDDWTANNHATNIRRVAILTDKADSSIVCVLTAYPNPANPGDPLQSSAAPHANCDTSDSKNKILFLKLDPDEYIIGISGQYSDHITSLRFYTNKKNSAVYGEGGGRAFGYTAPRGQMIIAFIGAGDTRLRSIGVMYGVCTPATKACK